MIESEQTRLESQIRAKLLESTGKELEQLEENEIRIALKGFITELTRIAIGMKRGKQISWEEWESTEVIERWRNIGIEIEEK